MKKTLIAALLAASSLPSLAADYLVVVPVPNRTPTAGNITVALNGYSLPAGVVGRAYTGFDFNSVLQVKGDPGFSPGAVRWSVVEGALPAGLALSAGGKLTGTPTAVGTSSFQVMATYKTKAGQLGYQVVVADINVGLAKAALPNGVQGAVYTYDLKQQLVSNDPAFNASAVTWSSVGTLPPGLTLNSNGTITGVPNAEGTYPFTVKASYVGKSGQQDYQVLVGAITVALGSAQLPDGKQGAAYSYDLKPKLKVDGDAAFTGAGVTWSVVSGSLPAGLALGSDGVISGTPTAENTGTPFTIQATYKTKTGQQAYTVLVGAIQVSLSATTSLPPGATVGQAYNGGNGWDIKPNLTITGDAAYAGNAAGVTWSLAGGALPAGMLLNSNGTVTGTPTGGGTNPLQVKADYKGKSATQSYTLALTQGISQNAGYRAWSDGTLAASCKEYRVGKPGYAYSGATGDGVYRIAVPGYAPFDVVCDMTTDGGGWTVFQRRWNGTVDFYRTWAEYAAGFGSTTEYWLGNNRLAAMTATGSHSMRIDMMRTNGQTAYAQYTSFKIGPASDNYRLGVNLTFVGGSAGDSLANGTSQLHNGMPFSTKDVDNDNVPSASCAQVYKGAWWYNACHASNLNGAYLNGPHSSYADGVEWYTWTGHYESLAHTEMKVREN
ncbi:fibrinogen-related protein [Burkholderia ubonensis]|uniref:fibrinogen-related protein n=1 Tax=Burkholderia ubonensis TaxID=101571 RepID=UPI00075A22B2|nr:fibrinogen-related protein [Burkholderia ubonensis]KVP39838.1 hypothetical protein WJ87_06555 [Burkholderia ubonensis]